MTRGFSFNSLYILAMLSVLLAGCFHSGNTRRVPEGIDDLAAQLESGIPKDKVLTLVVVDFSNFQGDTDDLGRYVAERLATRLSQRPAKIKIVERRRLLHILAENKIGMSGLVDASTAKKIGKLLGANALVLGTVTDIGDGLEINARILEVETGKALPGAMVSVKKDKVAKSLLGRARATSRRHPDSHKMVYVFNKGPYEVRVSPAIGRGAKEVSIAQPGRIQPLTYAGFDAMRIKASIYNATGELIMETPPEDFTGGAWVWIFNGANHERTRDTSILP